MSRHDGSNGCRLVLVTDGYEEEVVHDGRRRVFDYVRHENGTQIRGD